MIRSSIQKRQLTVNTHLIIESQNIRNKKQRKTKQTNKKHKKQKLTGLKRETEFYNNRGFNTQLSVMDITATRQKISKKIEDFNNPKTK